MSVAETADLLVATVNQVRRLSRALGPSTTCALLKLVLKEDETNFPTGQVRQDAQYRPSTPWDAEDWRVHQPTHGGGETQSVGLTDLLPVGLLE